MWRVTPLNYPLGAVNCPGILVQGRCFPGPGNTGVPPGTVLTNSGNVTITTPNTIIDSLNIVATGGGPGILIKAGASGCIIKNCMIDMNGSFFGISAAGSDNINGVTIQDCTIFDSNPKLTGQPEAILAAGATILRCNISGSTHSVAVDSGTTPLVQDNYMHDMAGGNSAHFENIYWGGDTPPPSVVIRHNTFFGFDTADIFVQNTSGDVSGTIIDNNLCRQGTPFGTLGPTQTVIQIEALVTTTGCQITNNIIELGLGVYGSVSNHAAPGCLWQNNRDYFTGTVQPPPANCFTP
jgi:hypothetical protein